MSKFEIKYFGENEWHPVSEKTLMQDLMDSFGHVTPAISEMLNGNEIMTKRGVYRIKNE